MSIVDEIKESFKKGDFLIKLIYINVGVFLAINIVAVVSHLFNLGITQYMFDFLAMPAYLPQLLWRIWTPISYMFLHEEFLHILFNMFCLFWLGRIFVEYLGQQKLLTIYIVGGLAGALLYLIAYNTLPAFSPTAYNPHLILGASGAVMAVMIAITTYLPNYTAHVPFIGPVKLKYVATVLVIIDILGMKGSNAGGHISHLGGAALGMYWAYKLRNGKDFLQPIHPMIMSVVKLFAPKKAKMKVHYNSEGRFTHVKPKSSAVDQGKMDKILDKIAKSGYDSLTKEEKDILFIMSKKNKS